MKALIPIAILLSAGSLVSAGVDNNVVSLKPVLGAGFETSMVVEGKIIDGTDALLRPGLGIPLRLIEISAIGDKALRRPIIMVLQFPPEGIEFPGRGARVKIRGFETEAFVGILNQIFKDSPKHLVRGHFRITKLLSSDRATRRGWQGAKSISTTPLINPITRLPSL